MSLVSRNTFIGPWTAHLWVTRGQGHQEPTKNLQGISTECSWNFFQNPSRDFLSQEQKEANIGPADPVFQVTDVTLSHFSFLDAEAVDLASNHS